MWIVMIALNLALPILYYVLMLSKITGNILVILFSVVTLGVITYHSAKNILKILLIMKKDLRIIDVVMYYVAVFVMYFIVTFTGGILEDRYVAYFLISLLVYSILHFTYGRLYTFHIERGVK